MFILACLTPADAAAMKFDIQDALIVGHGGHEGHDPGLHATDLEAGLALLRLNSDAAFLATVG